MKLISSNENKIREFKRILPEMEIVKGKDLPEVKGTKEEVIIHKSILAGKDFIVEDTILKINGQEVIDIKWKVDSLTEGDKVEWITSLGYNDGESIHVYGGITKGFITTSRSTTGFAFDPFFIPEELFNLSLTDENYHLNNLTLEELNKMNLKDNYSARTKALLNLKEEKPLFVVKIRHVDEWHGEYQNNDIKPEKKEENFYKTFSILMEVLESQKDIKLIEGAIKFQLEKLENSCFNRLEVFFTKENIEKFLESRIHWKDQNFENYKIEDVILLLQKCLQDYNNTFITNKPCKMKYFIYLKGYVEYLKRKTLLIEKE